MIFIYIVILGSLPFTQFLELCLSTRGPRMPEMCHLSGRGEEHLAPVCHVLSRILASAPHCHLASSSWFTQTTTQAPNITQDLSQGCVYFSQKCKNHKFFSRLTGAYGNLHLIPQSKRLDAEMSALLAFCHMIQRTCLLFIHLFLVFIFGCFILVAALRIFAVASL